MDFHKSLGVNIMQASAQTRKPTIFERCCLTVMAGECLGIIYVLGTTVVTAFNW